MQDRKTVPALRVMVVEDEAILGKALRAALENAGYIVTKVVSNAEEILANIKQERPDVILMDLVLRGEMNGIEATRHIKQKYPGISVIGRSMHSERQLIEGMLQAGAVAYVMKSSANEELFQAMEAAAKADGTQT
jgi:DNA-binding NarL/FixJ family response regulator